MSTEPSTTAAEFEKKHAPAAEVIDLEAKLEKAHRDHNKYVREHGGLINLFREFRETVAEVAMAPIKREYKPPRKTGSQTPVVCVSHWTDWHEGCVQEANETAGSGVFNPELLRNRMTNCVADELAWVELHRKIYPVHTNHIIVTGDMVNGELHYDDTVTNAYPPAVQVVKCGRFLAELVRAKSAHFDEVIVDFLVVDNHGRLTKKPQSKEGGLNHWGYVVGSMAEESLKHCANVKFRLHPVISTRVKVGPNRRYLLTHGDRIKGWAGFPYYGIERMVTREAVNAMYASKDAIIEADPSVPNARDLWLQHHFDKVIMGHWHQPLKHLFYWIGGSAQGTTAYDFGQGRRSPPVQCSWFVSPTHGEFDMIDWYLRDQTPCC